MIVSPPSYALRWTTSSTRPTTTKRRTRHKQQNNLQASTNCDHSYSQSSTPFVFLHYTLHQPILIFLLLLALFSSSNAFPFSDVSLSVGMHRPLGRRRKYGGAAVADLDGNGYPDLLCGHHGDRSMQIYFNNGDGTFTVSSFSFWRDLHGLNPFRPFPRSKTLYFIASTGGSRGKRPRYPHLFEILQNRSVVDVTERSRDLFTTYRRGRSAIAMSLRVRKQKYHHNHHNGNHHRSHHVIRQQHQNKHNVVPSHQDLLLLNRVDGSKAHHRAFTITSSGVLRHHTLGNNGFSDDGGRYGAVTDIDADGVMEVLMFGTLRMYKLKRDFFFTDITNNVFPSQYTREKKYQMVATHGIAELDYDGDGRFDLYVVRSATGTSRFYRQERIRDMLLRNVDGVRYDDVSVGSGIVIPSSDHRGSKGVWADAHGVTVGDFDNDGYIDIFVVNYHSSPAYILLRNLLGDPGYKPGNPVFEVIPAHTHGVRRSSRVNGDQATAVDYDLDGRLDLVLSEGNWGMDDSKRGYYRIMRNVCTNGNGFLIVRVGNAPGWTVTALHAVVTVKVSDKRTGGGMRRMVRRVGSPGTVVSNSFIENVHFGLGKARSVRSVEVKWTDGSVQRKDNVAANSKIVVGVIA